jgi:predicted nucleotide-binding protein
MGPTGKREWMRHSNGILYKATAAGRQALTKHEQRNIMTSETMMEEQLNSVFIVHGKDGKAKSEVANVIYRSGLRPIILHEQTNSGQTIIEKFETHAKVGFAVILLTPDDEGYPKNNPDHKKPRARQNVILEMGYFLGKIGRERVCALYIEGVEVPSDIQGILYIKMDESGAWKHELGREMKSAGLNVRLEDIAS